MSIEAIPASFRDPSGFVYKRDGLLLNRRGGGIAAVGQRAQQGRRDAKLFERHVVLLQRLQTVHKHGQARTLPENRARVGRCHGNGTPGRVCATKGVGVKQAAKAAGVTGKTIRRAQNLGIVPELGLGRSVAGIHASANLRWADGMNREGSSR